MDKVTVKPKTVTGTTEKNATVQERGNIIRGSKSKFTVKIKAKKAGTSLTVEAKDKDGNKIESTVIEVVFK
ncbi:MULTISPECIES: Ig-like domain-containing protein [unclassified Lysinibacillus]|uniref:Ig-like domain-containing protein n=1 Tax=unclassified Lysinibacillus TaxID=2636778 RepID=UPI0037FA8B16